MLWVRKHRQVQVALAGDGVEIECRRVVRCFAQGRRAGAKGRRVFKEYVGRPCICILCSGHPTLHEYL